MCGICGTLGKADEAELRLMARTMAHRGPDGEGVETFPGALPAGLGHRRLAILDSTLAGAQPMGFAGLQLYALLSLELWSRRFLDRTWRFDESLPAAPDPSLA